MSTRANQPNTNAYGDAPAWVNDKPAAIPPVTLDSNLVDLMSAHMAAIDVAAMAERYAAEKGLAIRYTSEDVRCMAATIYIQTQKGAGAR
jgi:spore germination cell wall hydrolase CwlJ-like protein